MSEVLWHAVEAREALEAAGTAELSDAARALLVDGLAPARFLDALVSEKLFLDAIRFLATALPAREAVLWASKSAREVHGEAPSAAIEAAIQAAERWASEPDEPNRREAEKAARVAGANTPAGCASLAAFWSGGSLAPESSPGVVPPPSHLTARGVTAAVMLAAVIREPEKAEEHYRNLLAIGSEIATGRLRFSTVLASTPSIKPT